MMEIRFKHTLAVEFWRPNWEDIQKVAGAIANDFNNSVHIEELGDSDQDATHLVTASWVDVHPLPFWAIQYIVECLSVAVESLILPSIRAAVSLETTAGLIDSAFDGEPLCFFAQDVHHDPSGFPEDAQVHPEPYPIS